jgi:exodeoxyribonuclease V alpha subunit
MKTEELYRRGEHIISVYPNILGLIDIQTAVYLASKATDNQEVVFDLCMVLGASLRVNRVSVNVSDIEGRSVIDILERMHPNEGDLSSEKGNGKRVDGTENHNESNSTDLTTSTNVHPFDFSVLNLKSIMNTSIVHVVDPADEPESVSDVQSPIVVQGSWVYFRRYWVSEWYIIRAIRNRLLPKLLSDAADFEQRVNDLFYDSNMRTEYQIASVLNSNRFPLSVITGGPGTGKTRTIVGLLTVFKELNPALKVLLCAPTGKAAARMVSSIQKAVEESMNGSVVDLNLPNKATTIHRLLGWNPSRGSFTYSELNRIDADLIVLDEASMVDLVLFSRLLRALPDHGRIILLGDKDQLASVEAGSVFGDITRIALGVNKQSVGLCSVSDLVTKLNHSWRFSSDSALGKLAASINQGDYQASVELLRSDQAGVVITSNNELFELYQQVSEHYAGICSLLEALRENSDSQQIRHVGEKALNQLADLQILTAHRSGKSGSLQLNQHIDNQFVSNSKDESEWYIGRPVIIIENDYDNSLFNGDVGITIEIDGERWVYFGFDESLQRNRLFRPSQLTRLESAWALTVHKSQGSEYAHVLLVLPEYTSPVLSRELVYTAVTRAKESVKIYSSLPIWKHSIQHSLQVNSGFADRLAKLG